MMMVISIALAFLLIYRACCWLRRHWRHCCCCDFFHWIRLYI